jgi:hypothetical protein
MISEVISLGTGRQALSYTKIGVKGIRPASLGSKGEKMVEEVIWVKSI